MVCSTRYPIIYYVIGLYAFNLFFTLYAKVKIKVDVKAA